MTAEHERRVRAWPSTANRGPSIDPPEVVDATLFRMVEESFRMVARPAVWSETCNGSRGNSPRSVSFALWPYCLEHMIRVVIVAGDAEHHHLRDTLERDPNVTIVGHARSSRELQDIINELHPQVIVADAAILHAGDSGLPRPAAMNDTVMIAAAPELDRRFRQQITVRIRGRLVVVPMDEIDLIRASGSYADVVTNGRCFTIRASLGALEADLDPAKFMRVHRSVIVHLRRIESFRRLSSGDGELYMACGARVRVSRRRCQALTRWLGVQAPERRRAHSRGGEHDRALQHDVHPGADVRGA